MVGMGIALIAASDKWEYEMETYIDENNTARLPKGVDVVKGEEDTYTTMRIGSRELPRWIHHHHIKQTIS